MSGFLQRAVDLQLLNRHHRLGPVRYPELAHYGRYVGFDRCLGYTKLIRNLLVHEALTEHQQHPELVRRQRADERRDIGLGAGQRFIA